MSSVKCARCEKTVYPIEELKCLDKSWHKGCFKCHECGMTLNMKTYKGYNRQPFCAAHCPQAKHTTVADTPEAKRLAENTKNQSQVKYHEDFEKAKGKVTQVADDPETMRIKNTSKIISNALYHGEYEKKKQMEEKRTLCGDEIPLGVGASGQMNGHMAAGPAPMTHQVSHQVNQHPHHPVPQMVIQTPQQPQIKQIHPQQIQQQKQQEMMNNHNIQAQLYQQQQQQQAQQKAQAAQHIQSAMGMNHQHLPQQQPPQLVNPQQMHLHHQQQQQQRQMHQQQMPQQIVMPVHGHGMMPPQMKQGIPPQHVMQHPMNGNGVSGPMIPVMQQQHPYQGQQVIHSQGGVPVNKQQIQQQQQQQQGQGQWSSPYSAKQQQHQTLVYSSEHGPVHQMPNRNVGSIADYDPVNGSPQHRVDPHSHPHQHPQQAMYYAGNGGGVNANIINNGVKLVQVTQQQQHQHVPPQQQNIAHGGDGGMSRRSGGLAVRAMYDYQAQDTDEVSFHDGDLIINCMPIDDGWMTGTVQRTGQTGMLPANYVEQVN